MLDSAHSRSELRGDGAGEKCKGEGGDEGGDGEVWERCGVGRGHGRVGKPRRTTIS